jgi:hypothetical protein
MTVGIPIPRGLLHDAAALAMTDAAGQPVAFEAHVSERWTDGSIRWMLAHFQIAGVPIGSRSLTIGPGERPPRAHVLSITESAGAATVDTGAGRFVIAPGTTFPFALDGASSTFTVVDSHRRVRHARFHRVVVESRGELAATLRVEGTVGPRRRPFIVVIARLQFYAGSAAVTIALTVRNPRRAAHRGGIWELGDRGSIHLREASLRVQFTEPLTAISGTHDVDHGVQSFAAPFELYQDSSGGEHWNHITHVTADGEIPCTFKGFRLRSGAGVTGGLRATPAIVARRTAGPIAICLQHFWQNFPKSFEADRQSLTLGLFPRQSAQPHELQGGEQKTHRFTLAIGEDPVANDSIFWGRAPALASPSPEWYSAAEAVPYLDPAQSGGDRRYSTLVNAAIEGDETFAIKRERMDEYGWRHFGDIYADHENPFSGEPQPIVSHYNNQYDAIAGMLCQYMRTGDSRWFRMSGELAAHVSDIDIYHTTRDKAAYNRGLFWHTAHYVAAGRSSHRSFPRHPRVHGGGPANEHNYAAGLRLHWLMTGDPLSRESALALAEWVIAMDDGHTSPLRWLSGADTGLASQTYDPSFHGPGRGAGHSILALLDGHRLTGEARFLLKAEQLIRRCIHPDDDIEALQLLDAERRWSYTVFLQVLGKYLDHKAERGECDAAYAYARSALLHYAAWMAAHERPYLDVPEILEFPTETWAAQDVRKAEVFLFAAGHSAGGRRERFLERARFFYDCSLERLQREPTSSMARPVILLLSNGFMPLSAQAARPRPEPACGPQDFGRPSRFVPQKSIAKGRLVSTAATLLVVVALATLLLAV